MKRRSGRTLPSAEEYIGACLDSSNDGVDFVDGHQDTRTQNVERFLDAARSGVDYVLNSKDL